MFFDIFLDILHKLNRNFDQEHVEGVLPSFQSKNWNNFSCYFWKNDSFFQFLLSLLFHPSIRKIWLSHLNKKYIFEISDNRVIL